MTTFPAESFYRATIRQSILSTTSVPFTLKVSKIPTLTSGLLTISPNTANEEIVEYNAVDGTALTITVSKRGIKPSSQALTTATVDYNNTTYQKAHSQNDAIRGDVNHLHIAQIDGYFNLSENETTTGNNTHSGAEVFTKSIKVPVYADATARDAGIPSPSNGMLIYNTAVGVLQQYIGGAWSSFASGTTVNADTATAGKVEIPTTTEAQALYSSGGTGAFLAMRPDMMGNYYSKGDGSDGNVTISVNTTLTRDMFYADLTVNTGVTLDPAGYAIYVSGTLTLSGTAKIARNGNNGSNATNSTGGAGGAALASGTCGVCEGGVAGKNGINGGLQHGNAGTWTASSGYSAVTGAAGGNGGTAGGSGGGTGGAGATSVQGVRYNRLYSLTQALSAIMSPSRGIYSTAPYGGTPGAGGGAAGEGSGNLGGGGGGSGGNGGNIFIYANIIAGTGTIEAKGGNGGNGGSGLAVFAGGGGGGGGGSGGVIVLVYNSGTPYTMTVTGGTGGTGAAGVGGGTTAGTAGASGTSGTTIVINK